MSFWKLVPAPHLEVTLGSLISQENKIKPTKITKTQALGKLISQQYKKKKKPTDRILECLGGTDPHEQNTELLLGTPPVMSTAKPSSLAWLSAGLNAERTTKPWPDVCVISSLSLEQHPLK